MPNKQIELTTPTVRTKGSAGKAARGHLGLPRQQPRHRPPRLHEYRALRPLARPQRATSSISTTPPSSTTSSTPSAWKSPTSSIACSPARSSPSDDSSLPALRQRRRGRLVPPPSRIDPACRHFSICVIFSHSGCGLGLRFSERGCRLGFARSRGRPLQPGRARDLDKSAGPANR